MFTKVKTADEITSMRESGRMLATVLNALQKQLAVGMTTKDLSEIAKSELQKLGGKPAFLGYYGYTDVLCVSLNEEVVHGIPSAKHIIMEGDIVSMDFGVDYQGMITDSAISKIAGTGSKKDQQLVAVTKRSLDAGIDVVKAGVYTGTIGNAVEKVLNKAGYGIVRDFVGHGVGHEIHEEPNVPNFGQIGSGKSLSAGMTIAIEPMAMLGVEDVYIAEDGWTVITKDHSRAAHFEHTVLITKGGSEILTQL